MFLKHLINPKPSIILFFIVFCLIFSLLPLIKFEMNIAFHHNYFHPIIVVLAGVALPFFISTGLNNIIYEKNIIKKDNLVVGCIFILINTPFINTIEAWASAFLLLFAFNFLLKTYQKDLPFSQFYNASIILGSLTFIYPNMIFLTLILIINGINYSNLHWRVLLTILLGLATPYLFYFFILFIIDRSFSIPEFFTFSKIDFPTIQEMHLSKIIWLGTLILTTVFSFFEIFIWLYKKSIKSRRSFMTIIWFFIVSVLMANYFGWEYFYFSLLPLSIIIGNYFVYTKKRKLASILFSLLIISSCYYKYMIGFNV